MSVRYRTGLFALGFLACALAGGLLTGCSLHDPTEDTVGLRVTNDLGVAARFGVCNDYECRDLKFVPDDGSTLQPRQTRQWNASSDPSVINPFLVEVAGRPDRCLFVRFRHRHHDGAASLSQGGPCKGTRRIAVTG